ncbi:MAG: hypothetical protein WA323_21330 [Candidatus Nitrosopolaris sp.]
MSKRKLLFCSPACAGKSRTAPPRAAECAFCAKRFWIAGRFVTFRSKEKKRKEKKRRRLASLPELVRVLIYESLIKRRE